MAVKGDVSDLDEFVFGGEPIVPMVGSFSRRRRSGVVRSDTQGGLTRQRKKYYGQTYLADVNYYLDTPAMQDYIKTFFERNEGKRFVAHLTADRPIVEPYVVQVVSDWEDTYASAVDGLLTVTLEIVSVRCPELDDFLFTQYQCNGDDTCDVLTGIIDLVEGAP